MHPGALLRNTILPALKASGYSQEDVAQALGTSRQNLASIAAERTDVSPEMALRFGKVFGNGPDLWLNLQRRFDLHKTAVAIADVLEGMPTLKVEQAA
jgi:addiction module HigA family antidote